MPDLGDIKQAASRANELVRDIGRTRRARLRKKATLDDAIQKLKDRHGPEITRLQTEEDKLINELVALVVPRFALLAFKGTRTIRLRNGHISMRTASRDKLVIADGVSEETIIRRIARHGGLRRFTNVKRTLDKEALKKDPGFVAKIRGLSIGRKTSLIIKPTRAQGEDIVHELDTLSADVTSSED